MERSHIRGRGVPAIFCVLFILTTALVVAVSSDPASDGRVSEPNLAPAIHEDPVKIPESMAAASSFGETASGEGGSMAFQGSPTPAKLSPLPAISNPPDEDQRHAIRQPLAPPTPVSHETIAGPPEQSTSPASISPSAAGDFVLFTDSVVTSTVFRSERNEPAVADQGRTIFYTGNWYAARSSDFGTTWSYVNPFSDMSDLCCDQDVLYDSGREIFLWYRQGLADSNGENRVRLSISLDAVDWWSYDLRPTDVDATWTNQWFDYPHLDLSSNYVYFTTNVFDSTDVWQRTVIFRWPLDPLRDGQGFSYSYYWSSSVSTFTTVGGASSVMYFASHVSNSVMRLYSWPESSESTGITSADITIPAYTPSPDGSMTCPAPDGSDWCAFSDDRILSGWVADGTIGFVWNVAQGGDFPWPYVEAATFNESTKAYEDRPLIWSTSNAWMYPAVYPNARGDLGVLAFWGNSTVAPSVALAIADGYSGAPPPWLFYTATQGSNGTSGDQWGDYARVRMYSGSGTLWAASGYTLFGGTTGDSAVPRYYVFGRWDDIPMVSFETNPASCGSIHFDGNAYANGEAVQTLPEVYTLSATPCAGYTLISWIATGSVSVAGSSVEVSGSGTITASFADVTPPALSIDSPPDGALLNSSSLSVSGTASDEGTGIAGVEVQVDSGAWMLAAYSGESWSIGANLAEGSHTICARASDNAGNLGPASVPCVGVTVDTVPPAVSIDQPLPDAIITTYSATVHWSMSDDGSGVNECSVILDGHTAIQVGLESSHEFFNLGDGNHEVRILCVDEAGNGGGATATFRVDTNPFSPTGPFGPWLLILAAAAGGVGVLIVVMLRRRRRK